jgi:hypothetical protein
MKTMIGINAKVESEPRAILQVLAGGAPGARITMSAPAGLKR